MDLPIPDGEEFAEVSQCEFEIAVKAMDYQREAYANGEKYFHVTRTWAGRRLELMGVRLLNPERYWLAK